MPPVVVAMTTCLSGEKLLRLTITPPLSASLPAASDQRLQTAADAPVIATAEKPLDPELNVTDAELSSVTSLQHERISHTAARRECNSAPSLRDGVSSSEVDVAADCGATNEALSSGTMHRTH